MDPILIVDSSADGLPQAAVYYRAFPRELSPLGELALKVANMKELRRISLDAVLDEMQKAGPGGIVVLVCHAYRHGMLLPLAPGSTSVFADIDNLATIDKIIGAEAEVASIRALPAKSPQIIERWTKLLNSLQPGWVVGTISAQEAEGAYAKWIGGWAKTFEFKTSAALRDFLKKVVKLRTLKLSRIELRACNIGSEPDTMEAVRKFFGVDHLTAPIVGTFFGWVPVFAMAPANGLSDHLGVIGAAQQPGPLRALPRVLDARSGALMAQTDHSRRAFLPVEGYVFDPRNDPSLKAAHFQFILTIDEIAAFKYSLFAYVVAAPNSHSPNWSKVRNFLDEWVMPGSTYASGGFPLAGLWTAEEGVVETPYVLPGEMGYLRCIEQAPPQFPQP